MAAKKGSLEQIETAREILRNSGLRSTPARIAVLNELNQITTPITHAELADRLVPSGFDKTTIFRNLSDLTEAKLVRRTELGDRVWRFELRNNKNHKEDHPHFVCVDCGVVSCLADVELSPSSRKRSTEIGRITEILIKGHCSDCDAVGT